MSNPIEKKEKPGNQILIECGKGQIKINGLKVSFPIHLNTLQDLFGEPSKQEYDLLWQVVWDELGIYVDYGSWDNILNMNFLLSSNHELRHFPTRFFSGQITIDKKNVTHDDFAEFDLKKHKVRKLTYKGYTEPYSISIGKNFDYKEEIPKDKYLIKDLTEEQIEFSDFGFKLSIIQELMYNKELLKPKFDLYEFVEWYDKREIDIDKEGHRPIPEVTQYFKDLPIPKKYTSDITEIYQDGGNDIYLQLLRYGEGWEDYWDIENTEDAKQFPNLKKAVLCYAKENVIDEFNKMGIECEWL
ncbi:DUF6892 domain-containing protein [Flagellimonas allohymeniacidonis]|uniref:Uncharacterized protein n=1 Tax=Flagellimonas allohymeniacidonis TaxID=2517819 RepID=A0A4Q8QBZ6_9FLAO|nr:hypothetical protein [Allomuricauda hymeniacidonis]TAI47841.1 hypothetical protein EW142_14395 [Allomuricauda hymeniacidonis]